jgi:hypothetical protein
VGALAASGAFTRNTSTPTLTTGGPKTQPPKTLTKTVTTPTSTRTVTTPTPPAGGSPPTPAAQIAALPSQYGYGLAASSGVHKGFAENAFYEYWQASGANPSLSEQISAWSRTYGKYIGLTCAPGDGVVDCTGLNDLGNTIDVRFTQNAVVIYTAAQAQQYAASGKLGPSG